MYLWAKNTPIMMRKTQGQSYGLIFFYTINMIALMILIRGIYISNLFNMSEFIEFHYVLYFWIGVLVLLPIQLVRLDLSRRYFFKTFMSFFRAYRYKENLIRIHYKYYKISVFCLLLLSILIFNVI